MKNEVKIKRLFKFNVDEKYSTKALDRMRLITSEDISSVKVKSDPSISFLFCVPGER